jgi:flagellin
MISLRTNVDSLNAQTSLKINSNFQSKTIQQLTTGYRINSSGDDAAGLAVANSYRSTITELTQGVSNGNDGISQLQIVDGGLNNISSILDRMKTLASQSASGTFTGNRTTLNQEYQQLVNEVTRQASNIKLNTGGSLNNLLNVYIGGGSSTSAGNVSVDLSGTSNAVDATSLGISTTNVLGGGVGISGNTVRMDAPGATFLSANSQSFTFNVYTTAGATTQTVTVGGSGAMTKDQVLDALNSSLSSLGVSAGLDSNGALQFSGAAAFTVSAGAPGGVSDDILSGTGTADNTANYVKNGQTTYAGVAQTLSVQTSNGSASVALLAADTLDSAIGKINSQTASSGVYAVKNSAGTGISFQGSNSFSVYASAGSGVFAAAGNNVATAPTTSTSNNASAAITAINNAIKTLGLVQGKVGAGENKLQYAITLAQSQISSFSSAESQIRDADVAAQAANLTKAQVLQQTSIAAMAQANAEPQSVLKLLQ